jgi:immunity protein, SdpI family
MKLQRGEVLALVLVVAAFLISVLFYGRLPEKIPTHWNIHDEVDAYSSKAFGAFVMPAVMAGLFLLFLALPAISPRGFRFESFRSVWGILQSAVLGLLLLAHALVLFAALGKPVDVPRGIEAGVGLLIAVLGNFLGKVSRNFFVGIRTPWTLASEEVWLRTHRLGGKLFVLAGLAMFVLALAGAGPLATNVPLIAAALVSVAASYFIYRRVEGFKEIPENNSAG